MVHEILYLEKKEGSVMVRPDHGPPDPIDPTHPAEKTLIRSNPIKWRVGYGPKYLTRNSKKPDPTRKLHIKLRANPTQPEPDPTMSWAGYGPIFFWPETRSDPTRQMIRSSHGTQDPLPRERRAYVIFIIQCHCSRILYAREGHLPLVDNELQLYDNDSIDAVLVVGRGQEDGSEDNYVTLHWCSPHSKGCGRSRRQRHPASSPSIQKWRGEGALEAKNIVSREMGGGRRANAA